ncbi:hypothetical protein N431DRAFT_79903 [Stipitochalara longipes BDJ]|nr:hypothetical protein N431DRAFT_79903 [Stipitochalara longipes BDJ]
MAAQLMLWFLTKAMPACDYIRALVVKASSLICLDSDRDNSKLQMSSVMFAVSVKNEGSAKRKLKLESAINGSGPQHPFVCKVQEQSLSRGAQLLCDLFRLANWEVCYLTFALTSFSSASEDGEPSGAVVFVSWVLAMKSANKDAKASPRTYVDAPVLQTP